MKILERTISSTSPALVIAEIGVNHDGRIERALELVEHARAAGADAVKLQIFNARTLMHQSTAFAAYQADRCAEASAAEMLENYELADDELSRVVDTIRQAGMMPIATPFSLEDVARCEELDLPAIKIASPDLVNEPLLRCAAMLGRPLLVSTGASTIAEIETTIAWLGAWNASFALLHCISAYPTADRDAHLCWISELAARFDGPVGYSDHTTELLAGPLAIAAGARIIEKHLTYDRSAIGPDHSASFDPAQFKQYVDLIRQAEMMCGQPGRRVLDVERDVRTVSRQSLVLRRSLKSGECVSPDDLTIQRPGTGIPAAELGKVVGRKVLAPLSAGTLLTWDMLHAA
jgi:sialic acid synthase SpsE